MAMVILDRQHSGKFTHVKDTGAGADLDGDGKIEVHEQEALLTPFYLLAAEMQLRTLGHDVVPMSHRAYSERHADACKVSATAAKAVYVAAHLNASGKAAKGYGSLFYDARSKSGPALGNAVAAALKVRCPELADDVRVIAANPGDWTGHAYNTISGVFVGRPVGLCFEPAFIDSPNHRPLMGPGGLERIGKALAEGIHAWSQA
jgi:hypothetical protein